MPSLGGPQTANKIPCDGNVRTTAAVEQTLEQLLDSLQRNRKLTEDIHDGIFLPRPEKDCGLKACVEQGLTLAQMIYKLMDHVDTTNEKLREIVSCLSEQLGDIKLD